MKKLLSLVDNCKECAYSYVDAEVFLNLTFHIWKCKLTGKELSLKNLGGHIPELCPLEDSSRE